MDGGILAIIITVATLIGGATGWLGRQYRYHREARRQAAHDASKTLNEKKTLLEDMISKTQDNISKQALISQLNEVNAALLGLQATRLRQSLKDAGLPPEEILIADGFRELQPQRVTQLEEAIAEAEALPPSILDRDFLMLVALAHYHVQQYEDAKRKYDQVLKLNPDDPIALANRGVLNFVMRKYDDALADHNRALEFKPDNPDILHNRGKLYASMGKHIKGLSDLNRSLELRPDDHYALNSRGATYHNLGKFEEALADYNRSLELNPSDALTLSNRGATYKRLEEYDKALADLNLSLELRPDFYPALINRGSIYERLKNYDKAICDYTHALEVEPDDPPTLYDLARLFSIQGKAKDALDFLRRVIDKDKHFCEVAKTNRDFDNIREDPRFKKLTESD